MEKYRRVEKPKSEFSDIKENEIRITTQGKMRNYISYATNLLADPNKQAVGIILKAMGRAINKTVTIAEIIKRRIPGLHQITQIDSTDITDVWEPLEEGLDRLETTRHVSSIQITLSTNPLDTNHPGYQPPLPVDQIKPISSADILEHPRRPRGRGGFRGRGRASVIAGQQEPAVADSGRGVFRGRGRGRGRGGRHPLNDQQNSNSNNNNQEGLNVISPQSIPRGRGRGGRGRPPRFQGASTGNIASSVNA